MRQFHVHDFATFGEMLLTGLMEANKRFEEMESEFRFVENVELGEEVYDVFMAKKKTGKPKDGEPSKYNMLNQILQSETFQSVRVLYFRLGAESESERSKHN